MQVKIAGDEERCYQTSLFGLPSESSGEFVAIRRTRMNEHSRLLRKRGGVCM